MNPALWIGDFMRAGYEVTECRNCDRPIVAIAPGKWRHWAADETLVAGCRAASFTPEAGWDESIDRRWQARP